MSVFDSDIQKLLQSGMVPLYIEYEKAFNFSTGKEIYRTMFNINSTRLGLLTFDQYRYVARRTKQADMIVERHMDKVFRHLDKLFEKIPNIDLVSLPVFVRLLKKGTLSNILFKGTFLKEAVLTSYNSKIPSLMLV